MYSKGTWALRVSWPRREVSGVGTSPDTHKLAEISCSVEGLGFRGGGGFRV